MSEKEEAHSVSQENSKSEAVSSPKHANESEDSEEEAEAEPQEANSEIPHIAANFISKIGEESLAPTPTPPEQIPTIVNNLREYYETGVTLSYQWRKNQLNALILILTKHEQHWVDAMYQDMGTHFFEAKLLMANIVSEIKDTIEHFEKWLKPEKRSNPWALTPGSTYVTPEPYGVVCDFIPFNYPMYLGFSTLLPIIAAGNVCLFKPSVSTPACSALYQRLFPRFLDPKAIAVVCGENSICDVILEQRFDFIFYTGSPRVGKLIMTHAAKYLTPVILELGGKSPVFFDQDVTLSKCVKRLIWGKFFNGGQTCVAPDYCLIHEKVWNDVIECVKKVIKKFYGESQETVINDNITRIINNIHFERISKAIDTSGGEVIMNGLRVQDQRYIGPTVIINPSLDSQLMTEEIFGPVLPLIKVENVDAALKFIKEREKPLSIYVMTNSSRIQKLFTERTSSGALMFNDTVFHVSSSSCPFGGVGNSGMGQYHGENGVRALSHLKPVINHKTTIDMEKRYPPYTMGNLNSLLKWV